MQILLYRVKSLDTTYLREETKNRDMFCVIFQTTTQDVLLETSPIMNVTRIAWMGVRAILPIINQPKNVNRIVAEHG